MLEPQPPPEALPNSRTEAMRQEHLKTIRVFETRRSSLPPDARNDFAAIIKGQDGDKRLVFSQPANWTDEKGAQNTGLIMIGPTGIDILGIDSKESISAPQLQETAKKTYELLTQINPDVQPDFKKIPSSPTQENALAVYVTDKEGNKKNSSYTY